MTDLGVSERRIRPIQDAVESSNWKQALQQCDKWLKKGEKSDKFLALKAYVLVNQPDKSQQDRGKTETIQLCQRIPAVTGVDAIYQLQETLKHLSLETDEGPKLWDRAIAAKPADKDLMVKWLDQSIADNQWLSAQKAAMAMRKAFPKDRQYEFWSILMCFLVHSAANVSEKDRQLFGTLGYRLMAKAAESVPDDKEQLLSPGKAISTPEELYLLLEIYTATGKAADAAKLLQLDKFGLKSRIGEQDPQLVITMLLSALEASEQWPELYNVCEELLSEDENKIDDRIWKALIVAESKAQSEEIRSRSRKLFEAFSDNESTPRNVQLAKLDFFQSTTDEEAPEKLLQCCLDYATQYGSKIFCFNDLDQPLKKLSPEARTKFLNHVADSGDDIPRQLLELKFKYNAITISNSSTAELLQISRAAIKLYRSSLNTNSKVPEAVLLATVALLQVYIIDKSPQYALQAVVLLSTCRTTFSDYYAYSVLLVMIQANLGLISLALESFSSLQVKNMQWETVGHLLLTRISSLHPMPYNGADERLNATGALDAGLTMLANADRALVKGIRDGLGYGSYINIINSINMRIEIERSMNRQIYAVEERKISRLLALSDDTVLPLRPDSLVDKRDFAFLPSYNAKDIKLYDQVHCGPIPKAAWIDAMAVLDNSSTFLKQELVSQSSTAAQAYENLLKTQKQLQSSSDNKSQGLTAVEVENLKCHEAISHLIMFAKDDSRQYSTEDLQSHIQAITNWIKDSSNDSLEAFGKPNEVHSIKHPGWEYIHTSLTQLETLQTLSMFCAYMIKKEKGKGSGAGKKGTSAPLIEKTQLSTWQTQIIDLEKKIHESAKELKKANNESGILGALVDIIMGRSEKSIDDGIAAEFEALYDETEVETLCGRIKESWEDALDGILAVKVKQYK